MKYFLVLLPLLIFFTSCSPTEELIDETAEEPEDEISLVPDWYESGIYSAADSLSMHGFSMASSADSTEAVRLSEETAINNLRFEIDKHAEETRRLLADTGQAYTASSYIVMLRNTVHGLNLTGAELVRQHKQAANGVYTVYTRATLSRGDVSSLMHNELDDPVFSEMFLSDQ